MCISSILFMAQTVHFPFMNFDYKNVHTHMKNHYRSLCVWKIKRKMTSGLSKNKKQHQPFFGVNSKKKPAIICVSRLMILFFAHHSIPLFFVSKHSFFDSIFITEIPYLCHCKFSLSLWIHCHEIFIGRYFLSIIWHIS